MVSNPQSAHASPLSVTVDVPARFYDDHVGRGLPAGNELKRLARTVRVELDRAAFEELLDDAKHYDASAEEMWDGSAGVVMSARATIRALRATETPWVTQ